MQNNEGASPAQETTAETSPTVMVGADGCEACGKKQSPCVGQTATAPWCLPVAKGIGEWLQTSFTALSDAQVSALRDLDLLRYIKQARSRANRALARRKAAQAEWMQTDCLGALGARDAAQLDLNAYWRAEQVAMREAHRRPDVWSVLMADMEAIASEVAA